MPRIFGTDGVRGLANGVITAELAVDLGVAAARVLVDHGGYAGQRPVAVVGRDTRISGQFLEHAVVAGLASAGVDVLRLRVLPTPGVAYLTDVARRRPRRRDLRVAQPDARQRHQVPGPGRGEARRLAGARDRGAPRRGLGPPDRGRHRPGHAVRRDRRGVRRPPRRHPRPPPGRPARRARLRQRRGSRRRPAGAPCRRRRGGRDQRPAQRAQHQRELRLDPPGGAARSRAGARRRRRLRPRRRRRPVPRGRPHRRDRSTATS